MLFSDKRRHSLVIPAKDKDGKAANVAFLMGYLCTKVMKDSRKELFMLDNHLYVSFDSIPMGCMRRCFLGSLHGPLTSLAPVRHAILPNTARHCNIYDAVADKSSTLHSRPGILVLINDADWELEGEEDYEIQSGDNILFVSTLHGG